MNTKKKKSADDFLIEKFSILVEALAKTFGSRCEVVLHDLRQLDKSIIKIEHGYITGRKVGGSITDLALRSIKKDMVNDLLVNYKTTTKSGRILKSTTILIRNKENNPIAALCLNIDITDIKSASSIMQELCELSENRDEIKETFEKDIDSTINSIIDSVIKHHHVTLPAMRKEDRMEIVSTLDGQGIFLTKGAIKIVANKLNVSKYTVYNYLEEIRSTRPS